MIVMNSVIHDSRLMEGGETHYLVSVVGEGRAAPADIGIGKEQHPYVKFK